MTCRPQTLNLLPQHCTLKTEYDSKTSPCSSHYEQVKGAWSSSIATTARENNGTLVRLGLKPRDDAPTSMGRGETPVELCQQPSVSLFFFFESLWIDRKLFN